MSALSQAEVSVATKAPVDEFSTLVEQYRLRAFHFALQLVGDREDAMDLTQEAFIKVHRNWQRRDPTRPFGPWFFTILRNLAIDLLRKRSTRKEDAVEEFYQASPRPGPQALAEKSEVQEKVWLAINQLSEDQREVVVLRDLQGFSYKEIAEIIGESTTTVNSRLHDAREILRRKLRGYL